MTRIEVPNSMGRRGRGGFGRWIVAMLLLLIVGYGLWAWLTLSWAYAEGDRAGVLQKFVRRGRAHCSASARAALHRGLVVQSVAPTKTTWPFGARASAAAATMAPGNGQRLCAEAY